MRFFCRFKGEEAEAIKRLFQEVGIGQGDGPSVRQFTKTAILRELKTLTELLEKHKENETIDTNEREKADEK